MKHLGHFYLKIYIILSCFTTLVSTSLWDSLSKVLGIDSEKEAHNDNTVFTESGSVSSVIDNSNLGDETDDLGKKPNSPPFGRW